MPVHDLIRSSPALLLARASCAPRRRPSLARIASTRPSSAPRPSFTGRPRGVSQTPGSSKHQSSSRVRDRLAVHPGQTRSRSRTGLPGTRKHEGGSRPERAEAPARRFAGPRASSARARPARLVTHWAYNRQRARRPPSRTIDLAGTSAASTGPGERITWVTAATASSLLWPRSISAVYTAAAARTSNTNSEQSSRSLVHGAAAASRS